MIRTANRQFRRNQGLGNGMDILRSVTGAATANAQVVIRSNITPEIRINLAELAKPGAPSAAAVQSDNATLMKLIKPEVIITGLGLEKRMAPYGSPKAGMFTIVAVGVSVAAALGGLVAWKICRG